MAKADPTDERLVLFGATVRRHRESNGMSQERFAEAAGLHRTYVGAVERGERNIGLLNVFAIADALNVDASELLQGGSRQK